MLDNDRALGLSWGAVAVASALLAPLAPRAAALAPPCVFRSVTGLPCPTCGATRAVLALCRLDPIRALAWNPLATVACLAVLVAGLAAGAAALAGRPLREPRYSSALRRAALLAVGGNWAWLLIHPPAP